MRPDKAGRNLGRAFVSPFTKKGLPALLLTFLFSLIPVVCEIAYAFAYSFAAEGGKTRFGTNIKRAFKMLFIRILYCAPFAVFYLLMTMFYMFHPDRIPLMMFILGAFLLFFAVRALLLIPVAMCAIALGAPIKVAAAPGEMYSLIGGSKGRTLLAIVFGVILLIPIPFLQLIPASLWILSYVIISLWNAIFQCVESNLYMSAVMHSLGGEVRDTTIPQPSPFARRAVAFCLAIFLILPFAVPSNAGLAMLEGPTDLDIFNTLKNEVSYAARNSVNWAVEGFWRAFDYEPKDSLTKAAYFTVDVGTDAIPVFCSVKSATLATIYGIRASITEPGEEQDKYISNCLYNGVSTFLGSAKAIATSNNWGSKVFKRLFDDYRKLDKAGSVLDKVNTWRNILVTVDDFMGWNRIQWAKWDNLVKAAKGVDEAAAKTLDDLHDLLTPNSTDPWAEFPQVPWKSNIPADQRYWPDYRPAEKTTVEGTWTGHTEKVTNDMSLEGVQLGIKVTADECPVRVIIDENWHFTFEADIQYKTKQMLFGIVDFDTISTASVRRNDQTFTKTASGGLTATFTVRGKVHDSSTGSGEPYGDDPVSGTETQDVVFMVTIQSDQNAQKVNGFSGTISVASDPGGKLDDKTLAQLNQYASLTLPFFVSRTGS